MRARIALVLLLWAARPGVAGTELSEVTRIGGADAGEEYLFGRITFVSVADDGSVFVADAQLEQIRRFDADGEFMANVGRVGEGPGEYRQIRGMVVLPTGELVVLSTPGRLTYFDGKTSEYVRDVPVASTLHTSGMLEYDNARFIYVKETAGQPQPGKEWSFEWLKIDPAGEIVGTISIPREESAPEPFVLIFPEGGRQNFPIATHCAWSPQGYTVVGRSDRYAFDINREDGAVHVVRDVEPVRLEKEERTEWRAWAGHFGGAGQTYEIPDVKPAFRDLHVDADGRIWVHRYVKARKVNLPPRAPGDDRPLSTWREPNTFDVFAPDGGFLGTVELPLLIRAAAWRGDSIWGVDHTDDGEQLVHWHVRGLAY